MCDDLDGNKLLTNIEEIARLGLFKKRRILHALTNAKSVESLYKHPAAWGELEDTALLFQFFALIGTTNLGDLDHLIKTKDDDGDVNWAIHPQIIKDIKEGGEKEGGRGRGGNAGSNEIRFIANYVHYSFWDLMRFTRNKIAHFGEPLRVLKSLPLFERVNCLLH